MIRDFIVRSKEDGSALTGTAVRIEAQDGHTFVPGNNINDGYGIGELGAGWDAPDGLVSVINSTGKYATPQTTLARLMSNPDGEMGIKIVDGPFGPKSRLDITLPFVAA